MCVAYAYVRTIFLIERNYSHEILQEVLHYIPIYIAYQHSVGPEVVPCRSQLTIMLLTIEHRFDGLECTSLQPDRVKM